MPSSLDIQIKSEIQQGDYGLWHAYAFVSTAMFRRGRGVPAADEYAMLAVAHALVARLCAQTSKALAEAKQKSLPPVPSADRSYTVKMETMGGTMAEAQAALMQLDRAIEAFKLTDIGL